jgi:CubicO group peptidase (beta-lactamase class C family)
MRKFIISITVFIAIVSCSSQKAKLEIEQKMQRIENGIAEFTTPRAIFEADRSKTQSINTLSERMLHYKVPGVSITVINDYKIEWAKGYGVIKAGSGTAVTPETFFEAASSTKLLTSLITLHFAEQGRFDLDENINKYLKSWKIPENDFTREKKVTLRLLLTHQAGISRPDGGFSWEEGSVPSLVQVWKGEAPAQNKPASVEFVPGSKWQYSNMGYVVIQQLLEDVLGKPFPQIAQETVFQPLGMKSSTLVYPLRTELKATEAVPHDAEGKAHEPSMVPTAVAHGGLMTTPSDFARLAVELMRAYQGQSGRILSQAMVRRMFHPELNLDPNMFGVPIAEGLGVFLYGKGQNLSFAHPGSNYPGANCWLIGFPESGKGAVIMTNGAGGEVLSMEILAAIKNEYN